MSFVKVVLLAVIAAALHLAYLVIPIFIGLPQFLMARTFGNFGFLLVTCLSATAMLTFLVVLWRDCSKLPTALSLRHAGLIAAVLRAVAIINLVFLYHNVTFTFFLRFLLPSVGWVAFFLTFFVLPAPLYSPLTRGLAGILAVFSVMNAVMSVYEMRNFGLSTSNAGASSLDAMRMPVGFIISLFTALCIGFLLAIIARGQDPAPVQSNTMESL